MGRNVENHRVISCNTVDELNALHEQHDEICEQITQLADPNNNAEQALSALGQDGEIAILLTSIAQNTPLLKALVPLVKITTKDINRILLMLAASAQFAAVECIAETYPNIVDTKILALAQQGAWPAIACLLKRKNIDYDMIVYFLAKAERFDCIDLIIGNQKSISIEYPLYLLACSHDFNTFTELAKRPGANLTGVVHLLITRHKQQILKKLLKQLASEQNTPLLSTLLDSRLALPFINHAIEGAELNSNQGLSRQLKSYQKKRRLSGGFEFMTCLFFIALFMTTTLSLLGIITNTLILSTILFTTCGIASKIAAYFLDKKASQLLDAPFYHDQQNLPKAFDVELILKTPKRSPLNETKDAKLGEPLAIDRQNAPAESSILKQSMP